MLQCTTTKNAKTDYVRVPFLLHGVHIHELVQCMFVVRLPSYALEIQMAQEPSLSANN